MKIKRTAIIATLATSILSTAVAAQEPYDFGSHLAWCYMIDSNGEVIDLSPMCDRPIKETPVVAAPSSANRGVVSTEFEDVLRAAGRSEAASYCRHLRAGLTRTGAFEKAEAESIFPRRLTAVERARVDVYRRNEVILRCGVIDRAMRGL